MQLSQQVVEREDLTLFVNACVASTGRAEYYDDSDEQQLSLGFLHEYVLGNYRRLYARTLALPLNDHNRSLLIAGLLSAGAPKDASEREQESALINRALRMLPPHRAWKTLALLQERKANNRRTRAIVRDFLAERSDLAFEAVKYRRAMRSAVAHAHASAPDEIARMLFASLRKAKPFTDPLLEARRIAQRSPEAIFALPYSVAESLAAFHRISRPRFLERIQKKMTANEKLRTQASMQRAGVRTTALDPQKLSLTKLAAYTLSLTSEQREAQLASLDEMLRTAATAQLTRTPLRLGRVAAVLDASGSAGGSSERHRGPLGVALGISYLLRAASETYQPFWSTPTSHDVLVRAEGRTDLVTPLAAAMAWKPTQIILVSDGFENDPPGGVEELVRVFRARCDPRGEVSIVHANPVFDAKRLAPRTLSKLVPTIGVRGAEEFPLMLPFARFVGGGSLDELLHWLDERVSNYLHTAKTPTTNTEGSEDVEHEE